MKQMIEPELFEMVYAFMLEEHWVIRLTAAEALGWINMEPTSAFPRMRHVFEHESNPQVKEVVAARLGELGLVAAGTLIAAMRPEESVGVRKVCCDGLLVIYYEAGREEVDVPGLKEAFATVPQLKARLRLSQMNAVEIATGPDEDGLWIEEARSDVEADEPLPAEALGFFHALLGHEHWGMRMVAALGLSHYGPEVTAVLGEALLRERNTDTGIVLACSLSERHLDGMPHLLNAMKHEDEEVRSASIEGLSQMPYWYTSGGEDVPTEMRMAFLTVPELRDSVLPLEECSFLEGVGTLKAERNAKRRLKLLYQRVGVH